MRRFDRLFVSGVGTGQNRQTQNAGIVKREVLPDKSSEEIVLLSKLVINTGTESLTVRIAAGIVGKVIAITGAVRQGVVQTDHSLGNLIQATRRNHIAG